MTINGARGFDYRIKDRFDLTLECIRRYYTGDRSPLSGEVLARYEGFFRLFETFQGCVESFCSRILLAPTTQQFASVRPSPSSLGHRCRRLWRHIAGTAIWPPSS